MREDNNGVFWANSCVVDTQITQGKLDEGVKDALLHTATQRLKMALWEHGFIVVPYNIKNQHWIMVLFANTQNVKGIFVLDSCGTSPAKAATPATTIRKLVKQSAMTPASYPVNATTHPLFCVKVPHQGNDYDCGIFVLCWMKALATMEAIPGSNEFVKLLEKIAPDQTKASALRLKLRATCEELLNIPK